MVCLFALTKEKAIGFLQITLPNGYVHVSTISEDPDLESLEGDERFEQMKKGDLLF